MDSRYNRLPKRIKRVTPQNDDTPESKNQKAYTFYRTIVHPLILMLNNGQGNKEMIFTNTEIFKLKFVIYFREAQLCFVVESIRQGGSK